MEQARGANPRLRQWSFPVRESRASIPLTAAAIEKPLEARRTDPQVKPSEPIMTSCFLPSRLNRLACPP